MEKGKYAVSAKDLHKSYGKLKVLNGVNLQIERGTVLALLGPNGAGKTTTVKILSTLLHPDKGSATVDGYDVVSKPAQVRSSIGLTGQFAAVDEYLTGEENLRLMGRLYRLSRKDSKDRAKQLLQQFDLVEAGKRPAKTYSGGMKRRLDLAMSLIASPPVIFLDEPTTGLDPRSRMTMWEIIRGLAAAGTTILLTTQYMEEADNLASQIIVMDQGKIIAEGTSAQLKSKVGSDHLEIVISKKPSYEKAKGVLTGKGVKYDDEQNTITVATRGGVGKLKEVLGKLDNAKVQVDAISLHQPTLDDVFLNLTGRTTAVEEAEGAKRKK
jgi:ABC-2 type transport system ATP-binding protein